jgi:hypothetical protein
VFANIGTVLLCLRKHNSNKSTGVHISAEVPLKARYLQYHVTGQLQAQMLQNNELVEEFIKLTGRQARSDTFSRLKHKKNLNLIFEQLYHYWQKREAASQRIDG